MKDQNLQIIDDWERESLKDFIYLCEESQDLDDIIQKELNRRQPAQIVVIDNSKIQKKQNEFKNNPLPF
jgi:hypothetical protein